MGERARPGIRTVGAVFFGYVAACSLFNTWLWHLAFSKGYPIRGIEPVGLHDLLFYVQVPGLTITLLIVILFALEHRGWRALWLQTYLGTLGLFAKLLLTMAFVLEPMSGATYGWYKGHHVQQALPPVRLDVDFAWGLFIADCCFCLAITILWTVAERIVDWRRVRLWAH
ncbi:MAG: hypothetical protein P8Z49_00690 [Acidobacteriota bacterium]|jgi:hypothetical protein